MKEFKQIIRKIRDLQNEGVSFCLAIVVHVDGSAYRRPGARMLISENGDWWGGISGGCLEGDMLKKAQFAMMSQSLQTVQYDTREDDPFELGIGLGCNGLIDILIIPHREYLISFVDLVEKQLEENSSSLILSTFSKKSFKEHSIKVCMHRPVSIDETSWATCQNFGSAFFWDTDDEYYFLERIPAKSRIWIFGNQFDSFNLIELCEWLDWEVHWVGNLTKMPAAYAAKVSFSYGWEDARSIMPTDHLVMMTHDFDRDIRLLTELIPSINPNQYLGVLGPKKRMDKLQSALRNTLTIEIRNRICSPIGLDLGAQGPYEIAVAIISEIIAYVNGRDGQFLRKRSGSIHG
jgi:xanthine/CO dehydrogenase XdhC/CoxF family maturation factor